jgi:hypothetical protein
VAYATRSLTDRVERLQKRVDEFESTSGIRIEEYGGGRRTGEIVRQLRELGYGTETGLRKLPEVLEGQEKTLTLLLQQLATARAAIDSISPSPAKEDA